MGEAILLHAESAAQHGLNKDEKDSDNSLFDVRFRSAVSNRLSNDLHNELFRDNEW